ncbi:MAG: SDR family NAD(P)-dependent oxidoreductase [Gammaproteobacteria bacterium]
MTKIKTVIVTGSSSGIGRATCELLLQAGYRVIGIARRPTAIVHAQFTGLCCDLADLETLPDFLGQLVKDVPHIDALVCNAGRGQFGSLEEFSYEQIRQLMDINFTSHAYMARAIVPVMKRQRSGRIVFMGSESALQGSRLGAIYCAGKFALRGLAQALRDECSRSGIQVGIINPGMVRSDFFHDLSFAPGEEDTHAIEVDDVARSIRFVIESRQGSVIDEINLSPLKHVVRMVERDQEP